ncbi:T-box transcription factor TBX2-B [Aphelenchoides avenae]|nr:T-box transcription factor TBX2-B [Aphelenchus avenae]
MSSHPSDIYSAERISATDASRVTITLAEEKLWSAFHEHTNEMIVTKAGRKMFPKMDIVATGLDPNAYYTFALHMKLASGSRYKFSNGVWQTAGEADIRVSSNMVTHHDHAQTGEYWMKSVVSFERLKLTNKPKVEGGSEISLCSMHKYHPVVQLVRYGPGGDAGGPVVEATFAPECAQFIAVTAYQNQKVIDLKVLYNPFAKGFREGSSRKRRQSESPVGDVAVKRTPFDFLNNNTSWRDAYFWEAYYNAFNAFGTQAASPHNAFPMMQQAPASLAQVQQTQMAQPMAPFNWCWPMFNAPQPPAFAGKTEGQEY